jgi:hypothetical protein
MDPRAQAIMAKLHQAKSENNIVVDSLVCQEIVNDSKVAGRENNIRTLDTIDTMIPDTKNIRTSDNSCISRPSAAANILTTSSISSGQAIEENDSSQVLAGPPKIVYAAASLKAPTGNRRTLNLDFRLNTTPSGKFNKLVFNLSDRSREFLNNVPDEWHPLPAYTEPKEVYAMSDAGTNKKWIGKGRLRGRWQEGKTPDKKIKKSTAAVLEEVKDGYVAHVWVDDFRLELTLRSSPNRQYPFKSEMIDDPSTQKYDDEGGWL